MHGEDIAYAYGFWSLVIVNIALFTAMYGFPLTIYILTAIMGSTVDNVFSKHVVMEQ